MSDGRIDASSLALLRARMDELEAENRQLRIALESRIVIEQANGVLIERFDLPAEAVFEILRSAARRSRRHLRVVADEIVQTSRHSRLPRTRDSQLPAQEASMASTALTQARMAETQARFREANERIETTA